jgi:hypothetical protein
LDSHYVTSSCASAAERGSVVHACFTHVFMVILNWDPHGFPFGTQLGSHLGPKLDPFGAHMGPHLELKWVTYIYVYIRIFYVYYMCIIRVLSADPLDHGRVDTINIIICLNIIKLTYNLWYLAPPGPAYPPMFRTCHLPKPFVFRVHC